MTTVHFDRTGGLLGDDIHLDLNLAELPDEEAQSLMHMIMDANFYEIPENLGEASIPEEFQYVITLHGGQAEHTVRTTNTTMPEALSPLVAALSVVNRIEEDEQEHIKSSD